MPTTETGDGSIPVAAAAASPSQHNLAHIGQQQKGECAATVGLPGRREAESLQPLFPNPHLPPPLIVEGRNSGQSTSEKLSLVRRETKSQESRSCIVHGHDLMEKKQRQSVPLGTQRSPSVETLARKQESDLQREGGEAPLAAPEGAADPLRSSVSVDPFLAAALLRHLAHTQDKKNPQLISGLLASVALAATRFGQQQQHQMRQQCSTRLEKNCSLLVDGSEKSCFSTAEASMNVIPGCDKHAISANVAASTIQTADVGAASAAVAVNRQYGFAMGTHELCKSRTVSALAAAVVVNDHGENLFSCNRMSYTPLIKTSREQPQAEELKTTAKTLPEAQESARTGQRPLGAVIVPTGLDTIEMLRRRGLHKSLEFVTSPWSSFISQFGRVIDVDMDGARLSSNRRLAARDRSVEKGFLPAGAEITRIVTRREASRRYALVHADLSLRNACFS
ncbi:hypothetical protein, conserved [Eimeria tenella]|uniref:Uncharacterized protein n=1 Tax=Eimeria tenella TaxID=5802 RepID=U6L3Y2_EIMTE|nr:hypothetical protein, conserved [Eimeria tenella]CDJ43334.1 hypothetical protein, conserved [Eimeria tenella]|eukprot:XP_013234084.1 hypothetical protein, conserved [Eimeria tenella]